MTSVLVRLERFEKPTAALGVVICTLGLAALARSSGAAEGSEPWDLGRFRQVSGEIEGLRVCARRFRCQLLPQHSDVLH